MINTSADPEGWAHALSEKLRDVDTLQDWLCGHLARQDDVSPTVSHKLAGVLSMGRVHDARAFGVPELLHCILTETPDIALAARLVLRDRYLEAHSEAVAAIKWRMEDGAEESERDGLSDMDDEYGGIDSERVL